jgi:large subunit ribosomal protein L6
MSRVGKNPIAIPDGVNVAIADGAITVKGKNGELRQTVLSDVSIAVEDNQIVIKPMSDSKFARSLWGTMRSTVESMVIGVSDGFRRELEIQGVGYRAQMQGKMLKLQLGFSHDVDFPVPEGISIECPSQVEIVVSGVDKQQVGQVASNIRSYRRPEPYKGKGVRYKGEFVLRKEGKKK